MTDKQRDMVAGVDWLLRKFNKYRDDKEFTVEEIIRASNEAVQEILTEVEGWLNYTEISRGKSSILYVAGRIINISSIMHMIVL